ncbi:MAG: MarR family transcriptional regulator [Chloroflexi bacterium]|nr:MarR family transcriptional regulator [Chloroflexota bacterium]
MRKPDFRNSHFTPENRQRFVDFVRQISPDTDPVSALLFGQIMKAQSQLVQAAEKNSKAVGLTWGKFRLLMYLMRGERHGIEFMQPSELSEAQGISRNTASNLISSLEKDELISRELHSSDHRKFLIRLTPKSRQLLHTQLDGHLRFIAACFESLNAEERQRLHEYLTRLNDHLSEKAK